MNTKRFLSVIFSGIALFLLTGTAHGMNPFNEYNQYQSYYLKTKVSPEKNLWYTQSLLSCMKKNSSDLPLEIYKLIESLYEWNSILSTQDPKNNNNTLLHAAAELLDDEAIFYLLSFAIKSGIYQKDLWENLEDLDTDTDDRFINIKNSNGKVAQEIATEKCKSQTSNEEKLQKYQRIESLFASYKEQKELTKKIVRLGKEKNKELEQKNLTPEKQNEYKEEIEQEIINQTTNIILQSKQPYTKLLFIYHFDKEDDAFSTKMDRHLLKEFWSSLDVWAKERMLRTGRYSLYSLMTESDTKTAKMLLSNNTEKEKDVIQKILLERDECGWNHFLRHATTKYLTLLLEACPKLAQEPIDKTGTTKDVLVKQKIDESIVPRYQEHIKLLKNLLALKTSNKENLDPASTTETINQLKNICGNLEEFEALQENFKKLEQEKTELSNEKNNISQQNNILAQGPNPTISRILWHFIPSLVAFASLCLGKDSAPNIYKKLGIIGATSLTHFLAGKYAYIVDAHNESFRAQGANLALVATIAAIQLKTLVSRL